MSISSILISSAILTDNSFGSVKGSFWFTNCSALLSDNRCSATFLWKVGYSKKNRPVAETQIRTQVQKAKKIRRRRSELPWKIASLPQKDFAALGSAHLDFKGWVEVETALWFIGTPDANWAKRCNFLPTTRRGLFSTLLVICQYFFSFGLFCATLIR